MSEFTTIDLQQQDTFLTAGQLPPNLLRLRSDTCHANGMVLKPGTMLKWAPGVVPMHVVRVGYRKTAKDYLEEAEILLQTPDGRAADLSLLRLVQNAEPKTNHRNRVQRLPDLPWALARALATQSRLGGPERGLHVRPLDHGDLLGRGPDHWFSARSTRCVRLGSYYSPSGGGEDHENGGLNNPRTVVLVNIGAGIETVSGWLAKVVIA